jgi:4-carboxymuconolactone decarboxylase
MNELNQRERELVALGAAMGSNCVPCIEYHIPEARKAGLTDSQISGAIRLADKVRQVPARKVLDTAHRMLPGSSEGAPGGGKPAETVQAAATGRPCCG